MCVTVCRRRQGEMVCLQVRPTSWVDCRLGLDAVMVSSQIWIHEYSVWPNHCFAHGHRCRFDRSHFWSAKKYFMNLPFGSQKTKFPFVEWIYLRWIFIWLFIERHLIQASVAVIDFLLLFRHFHFFFLRQVHTIRHEHDEIFIFVFPRFQLQIKSI